MKVSVNKTVKYHNFGYIPTGYFKNDLKGRLFGVFNLLKRLQAKDIIKALDIKPADVVLDFGCGSGYITVEMAKLSRKAYGIDVNSYIETIKIPEELQGRLEYIRTSGAKLPFSDNAFDVILASEILPMVSDPVDFLLEINRVLKPSGRLVISNGAGHPVIRDAFEKRHRFFRWLEKRYQERMPSSYDEYCAILQQSFGTAQKKYLQEDDIRGMLQSGGFKADYFDYTPGYLAGAYFSWSQFLLYLKTGKTISQHNFILKFYFFSFLRIFEKRRYLGGLLCVARKTDPV